MDCPECGSTMVEQSQRGTMKRKTTTVTWHECSSESCNMFYVDGAWIDAQERPAAMEGL